MKATLSKIDTIGKTSTAPTSDDDSTKSTDSELLQDEFSYDDLSEHWDVFVEKLKKNDVRMYAALKSVKPVLESGNSVIIQLQNNAQVDEFQARLRPIIQSDLREKLNNHAIEVTGTVVEAEKLERPNFLTENEKLQKMIDKNPALQLLRSKFKLDFE